MSTNTQGHGIDCATPITDSVAKSLVAANNSFVGRYMIRSTRLSDWKRLTISEAKIITDNNLKIVSIYETTTNRAIGGSVSGIEDGKIARAEAESIGMPKNGCIYFAIDFEATPKDYDIIEKYLVAAKSQIGRYKIGVYGSYFVIEEMKRRNLCDYYWQTVAWSKGMISKHNSLYQYNIDKPSYGINADLNYSYGNYGGWDLNSEETWEDILKSISANSSEWIDAINNIVIASSTSKLGNLGILKYLPALIKKIDKLKYMGPKSSQDIITVASVSYNEWGVAIDAIVNAANTEGDLGNIEIFKHLPLLFVKIYEANK